MQMALYFDQTKCTGCYACYMACKEWHNIPASSAQWLRVEEMESGKYPNVFVSATFTTCYHCENPACAEICPTNCITKRSEDGVVVINPKECLGKEGCGQCSEACPYGAVQFRSEPEAKMEKCDFCLDRLAEGRSPACVSACPLRALGFGDRSELQAKYGQHGELKTGTGFTYDEKTKPAFAIRGKFAKNDR